MMILPVGLSLTPEQVHPVRTAAQRETVMIIAADPQFAFATSNPFTDDMGDYVGPFVFMWYTQDEEIHAVRIGKNGEILRRIVG